MSTACERPHICFLSRCDPSTSAYMKISLRKRPCKRIHPLKSPLEFLLLKSKLPLMIEPPSI